MKNRVITISREFGSGGRELGRYLADELGWTYYDKQIVSAIAQESELSEEYVARAAERGLRGNIPSRCGAHSLTAARPSPTP